MKFAHFSHVWIKPEMTPAQRYEQLWRELSLADKLGVDFGFGELDALAAGLLHCRRLPAKVFSTRSLVSLILGR